MSARPPNPESAKGQPTTNGPAPQITPTRTESLKPVHETSKPLAPTPVFDSIDKELTARPQWVLWNYQWDGERWTKVPKKPDGYGASTTDLMTWSRFKTVVDAYRKGGFDGIGFVTCSGDPYQMIDLDHCIDLDTGVVAEWANEILQDAKSEGAYVELSPSKTGFHIIGCGKQDVRGTKRNDAELYTSGRFFTITGVLA